MASERRPELQEVIAAYLDAQLLQLDTAKPARVVTVHTDDSGNITGVDCKPLVKRAYMDEEAQRQLESLPVIPNVPVCFPGGGGYRSTWPVKGGDVGVGDTCVLLITDCSLDKWLTGAGDEVDPEIDHTHSMTDAVAILGLRPTGAPWKSIPSDHATSGADEGVQVHYHADKVVVADDESGTKAVGLDGDSSDAGKLRAVIAVSGALIAVTISYVPPGGGTPVVWFAFGATGTGTAGTYDVPLSATLGASATQLKTK